MKQFTLYELDTGRVSHTGSCPDEDFNLQARDGMGLIEGLFSAEQFYWNGSEMVAIPAQPAGYAWDWTSKTWQPDVPTAKGQKMAAIEAERDRRLTAPIMAYDGANLDADQRAISNLSNKLAEVNSRIAQNQPLTSNQLVWRTADNNMLTFADMTSYKNWLDGFAIALGSRGTDAYSWSWQKKSALDALTTIEDVEAFDPTT